MLPFSLITALLLFTAVRVSLSLGFRIAAVLYGVLFASNAIFILVAALPRRRVTFLRGRRKPTATNKMERRTRTGPGEFIIWGGEQLPAENATTHFLVAGTTGSGKTLILNQLMRSALPFIGRRRADGKPFDRRALIYDAKGDVLSTVHQIAGCRIETLHPFDARGVAWNIAKDITTPASALQAASLLIPHDRQASGNPFFVLAAQNLLRGVLLSFIESAGDTWTFRDVVLALRFEERLRQVLEKSQEGRAILDQFFKAGSEMLQGVRATIATKIAPYEVVAASWEAAKTRVSLLEFLAGEFILVLGNDEASRTALDALNRVLFQRLTELLLSGPETRTRQTWIFLDEVREAGRLDGLSRLMTKGRSKGACVALGFQAIEGMREVYGANVADEITGLCNNKAILRLESPNSAEWASALFGKTEEIDKRESSSRSQSERGILPVFGRSRTTSEQRLITDAVMASEIMTLTPTSPEHGISGFFITRAKGAYRRTIPWGKIVPRSKDAIAVPNFVARSEKTQYLHEWTPADLDRLELKAVRLLKDDTLQGGLAQRQAPSIESESQHRRLKPIR